MSLEALRHVRQRHRERLHGRERVLKVQRVGVAVYPAELHHLSESEQRSSENGHATDHLI